MKTDTKATTTCVLVATAIILAAIPFVLAEPIAPDGLTEVQSSSRDLSQLGAQSINAQGGNVTEVNINALTITQSWQGYYGAVNGEITLDDGSNNTFYNWSIATVAGQVYATRANSITWDNVNCSTATNITSEETFLGHAATDGDSVTNTFNQNLHPGFNITTSREIFANNCSSTFGYVNNASQSADWSQVLLHDLEENIVYSTIINDTTTGFDGQNHDFQILVGENEHQGSLGVTPYFLWVQLI